MCGILAYLSNKECILDDNKEKYNEKLKKWKIDCHSRVNKLKPRGPDKHKYLFYKNLFLGFQRLSIIDLSQEGDQPFTDKNHIASLICNGEIYNYKELIQKYNLCLDGNSDCEVILRMYLKFGIEKTLEELDGVFAFAIYDYNTKELVCARDPFGVRPLFLSISEKGIVASSELKPLDGLKNVIAFPIGSYWCSRSRVFKQFHHYNNDIKQKTLSCPDAFLKNYKFNNLSLEEIKQNIKTKLINSVTKRLHSDRKIGCLLSGGLDSSLVTSLVKRIGKKNVVTYSVGLEGSLDLENARKVAKFLETEHHEIIFSEQTGLQSIEKVICATETWDTTTIRASIPMWLMCKYIKEKTPEIKVIMSGEGADEVCQGYLYFHKQPNAMEGHKESVRLLQDLLFFDVLRSDRSVASNGLEVRVPFLDKEFVHFYMSIPPKLKCPNKEKKCEKWLLRESFTDEKLLPKEILWRRKDGLSDGCSSLKRPWYKVIEEKAELEITDEELKNAKNKYTHCTPMTKEALLFRNIFTKHFPNRDKLVPYQWMPKWCGNMTNPSGRLMTAFDEK